MNYIGITMKKIKSLLFTTALFAASQLFAQGVGISESAITPDASAILELRSTTRGLLLPRLTSINRDAITTLGMTLYNSTTNTVDFYNGSWLSLAPTASPTFTGTVTIPTPFTLGATSMTSTGTQLNYLNAATGTTGTTSSNLVFSASPTLTGTTLAAGTATVDPLTFTSGTNLTTPAAGAMEFDGNAFYLTVDATNGRTQESNQQIFRLTANGSAIGPAIADFFGANSAIPTVTNGVYELTFYLFFLKTTAGTVTYTITNTATYNNIVAQYVQSAAGGIATSAAQTGAGIVGVTAAAAALPATASLTTAVNHKVVIRAVAECGTAGNIRLRITSSAGTVTPLRGSYFTVRRLASGNVGTFVP